MIVAERPYPYKIIIRSTRETHSRRARRRGQTMISFTAILLCKYFCEIAKLREPPRGAERVLPGTPRSSALCPRTWCLEPKVALPISIGYRCLLRT